MRRIDLKKTVLLLCAVWLTAACSNPQTTNESTTLTTVITQESSKQVVDQNATVTLNISVDGQPVEGSPFALEVEKGTKLLDVMKEHLDIQEANGFISSINGIEQNTGEHQGKWWLFDYNGKMSEVGASEVILNDGDIVDWKLELFES